MSFSQPSIILADLLGNRSLLQQVQKVTVCDCWILICFVYFCVSGFITCDCNKKNYEWQQWKTQLWRRLWNFRVHVFLKSTVKDSKTLRDDSTFSCHKNFTLCEEWSLLVSLGTLSKLLWQPLIRQRWTRSSGESMSPQPTKFQL